MEENVCLMQIIETKLNIFYVVDYETQCQYLGGIPSLEAAYNYCLRYVKPENIAINRYKER